MENIYEEEFERLREVVKKWNWNVITVIIVLLWLKIEVLYYLGALGNIVLRLNQFGATLYVQSKKYKQGNL